MVLSVPAGPEQSTAAASQANISPVKTSEPTVLTHWDDNDVKLLIDGYSKHKHFFKKGRTTNKVVFEQVAKYFNADRKSTRLNSSHANISYAVFCLKKKTQYFYFTRPPYSIYPHHFFSFP